MWRVVRVSRKWYALQFSESLMDAGQETENIQDLVDNGDLVILSDDLDAVRELIDDDIQIVEQE
jgi:hypothetical protein